MQLGMIRRGPIVANTARRLMKAAHGCVVHDTRPDAVAALSAQAAVDARSLEELSAKLTRPRTVWPMVPSASVDEALEQLALHLDSGDMVVDDAGRNRAVAPAEDGFLHCRRSGASHFVKIVHNGIEHGVMAAYAEGLNVLRKANVGQRKQASDAETTPLRHPEFYRYEMNLPEIVEIWRRGSVIGSWLLDLTAGALPERERLSSRHN